MGDASTLQPPRPRGFEGGGKTLNQPAKSQLVMEDLVAVPLPLSVPHFDCKLLSRPILNIASAILLNLSSCTWRSRSAVRMSSRATSPSSSVESSMSCAQVAPAAQAWRREGCGYEFGVWKRWDSGARS